MHVRFQRLYKDKGNLRHYTHFTEEGDVEAASTTVVDLIGDYTSLENSKRMPRWSRAGGEAGWAGPQRG